MSIVKGGLLCATLAVAGLAAAVSGQGTAGRTSGDHHQRVMPAAGDGLAVGGGVEPVGLGGVGDDEQVVGPSDVSNLDIDFGAVEEAIAGTGEDFVMLWLSGDDEESEVVVAVHGDVSEVELAAAVGSVTPHVDRFRFVPSKYSTAELEQFVEVAQDVWERQDLGWGGPRGRWVLDDLLESGRYGSPDSQPAVWVLVEPDREAEVTAALREVIPADAMVIDPNAQPAAE